MYNFIDFSLILTLTMNPIITLSLLFAAVSAFKVPEMYEDFPGNRPPYCPDIFPMECGPEDMICPGGMDPEGCPMPDMCWPAIGPMGEDGIECPSHCPVMCGMDQMMCPGIIDFAGCMGPETCQPMMDAIGCPLACPAPCGPEEMVCAGGMDMNGCPYPDMCIPFDGPMDFNGDPCPAFCPTVCAPGDMLCPGGVNETGCVNPDFCQPEGIECLMPPMSMEK